MNDAELAELETLAEKATPGPWAPLVYPVVTLGGTVVGNGWDVAQCSCQASDQCEADAEFIAASRAAVPALCAEVRRLRRFSDTARLDGMWQSLVREKDEAVLPLRRLRQTYLDIAEAVGLVSHAEGTGAAEVASPEVLIAHVRECSRAYAQHTELMESCSMACECPPPNCDCAGCSYAREKGGAQ